MLTKLKHSKTYDFLSSIVLPLPFALFAILFLGTAQYTKIFDRSAFMLLQKFLFYAPGNLLNQHTDLVKFVVQTQFADPKSQHQEQPAFFSAIEVF